jgi:hypothetical protein
LFLGVACFTFYRYIDDVLYINNSRFAEFLPLIYPPELEVKETTDTASSASFLDLYLEFDDSGQLSKVPAVTITVFITIQEQNR